MKDKARRFNPLIVVVTIVAWFSISNHCALSALTAATPRSAVAQMHCHGNQSAPTKKSSEEEAPCCKMLRATVTTEAKTVQVASKDFLPLKGLTVSRLIFADEAQFHRTPLELDTGPPSFGSFAESVLQRSILTHAPPLLGND